MNYQDNDGKTALHFGILYFQFIFQFKLLILYIYLLHHISASQQGHLEVVQSLLQNRADINLQEKEGCSALILGKLFNFDLNSLFKYFKYLSFSEWLFRNSETTLSKQC